MLEYGGVCAGCERRARNFSSCRHGRNAKLDERPVQYHAGVIAVAVGAELLEQRVADCGAARLGVLRIECTCKSGMREYGRARGCVKTVAASVKLSEVRPGKPIVQ